MRRIKSGDAHKAPKGFTLMEALIALAVLAIIAAIALPIFTKARSGAGERLVRPRLQNIAAAETSFRSTLGKNRYAPLSELRNTLVEGVPLISPTLMKEAGGSVSFDGWALSEVEPAGSNTFGIKAVPLGGGKSTGPGGDAQGGAIQSDCSSIAYCIFEDNVVRKGTACDCTRKSDPLGKSDPLEGPPKDGSPTDDLPPHITPILKPWLPGK